ncbi:unannotated protein [freshwater metagenome]|uniref:Unannotated protein n=1 Tax=freshwater metagenome TaxID=449393 RepID=A0A6J7I7Q2_9ZZZZ
MSRREPHHGLNICRRGDTRNGEWRTCAGIVRTIPAVSSHPVLIDDETTLRQCVNQLLQVH